MANYVIAKKLMLEKYEIIFWLTCAPHYLNMFLNDSSIMLHVIKLASKTSKVTNLCTTYDFLILAQEKKW